jgi:hypothetical protein
MPKPTKTHEFQGRPARLEESIHAVDAIAEETARMKAR